MRRRLFFIATVLLLIMTANPAAHAACTVIAEPGARELDIINVNKGIAIFNDIVKESLKTSLTREISIFLCPTRENFAAVLQRELDFSEEKALQYSRLFFGVSSGNKGKIILRLDPKLGMPMFVAYYTTPHELMHQLQTQLIGPQGSYRMKWMIEGTADLIAERVFAKIGLSSMENSEANLVNNLQRAPSYVAPHDILYITQTQWTEFSEAKQYPYEVAELMVFYLMKIAPKDPYQGIATYFSTPTNMYTNDRETFKQAFGISLDEFVARFEKWLKDELAKAA
jgi:hypothetical protein